MNSIYEENLLDKGNGIHNSIRTNVKLGVDKMARRVDKVRTRKM